MKKTFLLVFFIIILAACDKKSVVNNEVTVKFSFSHYWDNVPVNSNFGTIQYASLHGEELSIERLRYVVSKITLQNSEHSYTLHHQLINLIEGTTNFTMENIVPGTYTVSFVFGFTDEDNIDGEYLDLNSVSFNVPQMLGGGYHYMQMDGKFIDNNNQQANYNYHMIRAVDKTDPENIRFQDTSFEVTLGTHELSSNEGLLTIPIRMNIAEWFKNPHTWNLNELNTVLMPNFDAQLLMNQNGKTVFSLGQITNN